MPTAPPPPSYSPGQPGSDTGPPAAVDFQLIDRARRLFEEAFPTEVLPATWSHGNRTFSIHDYLGFMLLALHVPTCDSLRGLCSASELEEFRHRYDCQRMDLGSVSKAQAHVPEELLLPVIARLGEEARRRSPQSPGDAAGGGSEAEQIGKFLLRVSDSSVFQALPGMVWALFGAGRKRNDGRKTASVRFHVSFDPIALCPLACEVTSAAVDEKRKWKSLMPGKPPDKLTGNPATVEVGDRNFGSNYTLLSDLTDEGTNFVVRIKESAVVDILEELAVSELEKVAGIVRHAWVRLGGGRKNRGHHRMRLIWLGRGDKIIVLATNLPQDEAAVLVVAEMYRHRWEIELFFWWLKKILKVGHWFARSEKGVRTQLYLVMILALLLQLQTGRRPTKRMIELLHFYAQGLAGDAELMAGLKELARQADLARESSRKRYLAGKREAVG